MTNAWCDKARLVPRKKTTRATTTMISSSTIKQPHQFPEMRCVDGVSYFFGSILP